MLSGEALEWAYEQLTKSEERKASLTREDYYSVLDDLYRKLNPPAASGLIRIVRETSPSIDWLDRAIVLNQSLLRMQGQESNPTLPQAPELPLQ